MADRIDLDTSDVHRLAVDLTGAAAKVQIGANVELEASAVRVRDGMKADATGHAFLPRLPEYVSYERVALALLAYDIGFDKRGQGNLANIAAFGTSKNAPVMDHTASLRREEPVVVAAMLALGEKSLE